MIKASCNPINSSSIINDLILGPSPKKEKGAALLKTNPNHVWPGESPSLLGEGYRGRWKALEYYLHLNKSFKN